VQTTLGLKYDRLRWTRILWKPADAKEKGQIEDTHGALYWHMISPAKFCTFICYLNLPFSPALNMLSYYQFAALIPSGMMG
jgi:hypothetical protein